MAYEHGGRRARADAADGISIRRMIVARLPLRRGDDK